MERGHEHTSAAARHSHVLAPGTEINLLASSGLMRVVQRQAKTWRIRDNFISDPFHLLRLIVPFLRTR